MIINKELANRTVASSFGEIKFNDKGESNDLTKDQQKHLGDKVRGFSYVEDKAPKKEKEAKASDASAEKELPKDDGKAEAMIVDEDKAKAMIKDEDKAAAMDVEEPKKPTRRRAPAKSKDK